MEEFYCDKSRTEKVMHKREPGEIWINQYNTPLLKAWNANIDVQFVFNAYACIKYIASYISKSERTLSTLLEKARNVILRENNPTAQEIMKQLRSIYFHLRELSSQESAYRVCTLPMKGASRKVQFIPTVN